MLTADPLPYAAFIARHLVLPVGPRFGIRHAVAETEDAMAGDRWFWSDDNAKVVEFLSLPIVAQAFPEAAEAAFGFLKDLCSAPFIYRRVGQPRLDTVENDGARATFVHSLMDISCDLPRGIVKVGVRFHDGRTASNLTLTGNYVRFTHQGTVHTLDVEEAIDGWEVAQRDGLLELAHASELRFREGGRVLRLGRLVYTYRFDARSMVFRAGAALDLDPAVTVSDVALTVGADNLSHGEINIAYDAVRVDRPGEAPLRIAPEGAAEALHPLPGAPYWSISQDGAMRGFSPAIHSIPREPGRLSLLRVVSHEGGRLHWVAAEHAFPGEHRGARLAMEEAKILTSGGFYDRVPDYAAVVRAEASVAPSQPLDLSLSYDYGVEITAFARRARALAAAGPAAAPALEEALALHDGLLAAYEDNMLAAARTDRRAIFSRPLSFVVMGLVDALAVTGAPRHRAALRRSVDALLAFERPESDVVGAPVSVFPMGHGESPYLDCHAAALLALTRAAPALDDPRLAAAVDRAMGAYALSTASIDLGGHVEKHDLVAVEVHHPGGVRTTMPGFWNYAAGLSLRGFAALRRSGYGPLREVSARHVGRMDVLGSVMRAQVARSLRQRGDALEIRTSVRAGESNSETQPWVAMALVAEPGDVG